MRPPVRLADVAGYEGAKREIGEVVDFLRDPGRYRRVGARGPRGMLLVGPPGTGKTLLARAVAGEAEVPFLSVAGSALVETFTGAGASRMRDLFAEARRRAPSVVFIDEIDEIDTTGEPRGGGRPGGSHNEHGSTLVQLLAELDGVEPGSAVVVLAATNRPEALDRALLRPGRFDRQVTVPLPARSERAEILAVHTRGTHLADDVDLTRVAQATPGFSGADLANLVNEAAVGAARAGRSTIGATDLDAARDRLLLGRRGVSNGLAASNSLAVTNGLAASNALLPEEKRCVAVHESGHALVAALCADAEPVATVTILPTGLALGVARGLPEAERHLHTENHLTDSLAVRLGGRAAELVVFGHGSTGAASDLAGATGLATRMVREFGLSEEIGPVSYAFDGPGYLGGDEPAPSPCSEQTRRLIDVEVARLLREAEARAVDLLRMHREALDDLTARLLAEETVDGAVVEEVAAASVARFTRTPGGTGPHGDGPDGGIPPQVSLWT